MAKILKKIGALMLAFTMTVGAVGGVATDVAYGAEKITKAEIDDAVYWCKLNPVKLALNGEKVFFKEGETPPIIMNNSTLVPARTVFEGLGGTVGWHAGNQQVTVYYGDKTIILTIGSNVARVNNERKTMSVPALIADYDGDGIGSTMIPLRFTAEAIGCEVGWEDATRTAKVNSPVKEEEKTDTDKKEEETTKPSNPSKGDESTNEGTTGGNSTGNSGTETDGLAAGDIHSGESGAAGGGRLPGGGSAGGGGGYPEAHSGTLRDIQEAAPQVRTQQGSCGSKPCECPEQVLRAEGSYVGARKLLPSGSPLSVDNSFGEIPEKVP